MQRSTPLVVALVALATGAAPAAAQQAPVDVTTLVPSSLVYSMSAMGTHIMDMTRDITREQVDGVDAVVVHSNAEGGMMSTSSDLTLAVAGFTPMAFTMNMSQGGMALSQEIRVVDGRVVGRVEMPGNNMDVDAELPPGTLFSGMDELVMQVTDWATTDSLTVSLFAAGRGATPMRIRKVGTESVTVPAGTFETYKLEVSAAGQQMELWLRQEGPHILVKQFVPAQGVTLELKEIRTAS